MFSTKQLSAVQARTRAAILAATASALAANRTATMPEIATVAGVGRTTLHCYFADRETLIYEVTAAVAVARVEPGEAEFRADDRRKRAEENRDRSDLAAR
ncbi:TetR family transcriptional regulator [Mycobacterium colombiense]|uniref:TetR family transcriptional regulator n=1 Tax=Mycobacterium colombiense TaxID=339268 RepID=UPI000AA8A341|nr:TetR family transcriptional regulator [Mycobacterium colombiense]